MITGTLTLTELVCCNCSTHFAVDNELYSRRQADGSSFWCPNGHSQHFTETDVMRLKAQVQSLKSSLEWEKIEADNARRERKVARAKLTKMKNQIAYGVCPCCHRHFTNVENHISHMHPDFKKAVS